MLVVDTNVLVYAADRASPFHGACHAWLEERRQKADVWYLTWGIVFEFLRVVTHPKVLRTPWSLTSAWSFIDALLSSPSASILVESERHTGVVAEAIPQYPELAGNVIHDFRTLALMRDHGVSQICTRDTDFHRFRGLTVIDPIRP